jgi:hypothetical protein
MQRPQIEDSTVAICSQRNAYRTLNHRRRQISVALEKSAVLHSRIDTAEPEEGLDGWCTAPALYDRGLRLTPLPWTPGNLPRDIWKIQFTSFIKIN